MPFTDPDGTSLALVGVAGAESEVDGATATFPSSMPSAAFTA
jgi:hypothetical protein